MIIVFISNKYVLMKKIIDLDWKSVDLIFSNINIKYIYIGIAERFCCDTCLHPVVARVNFERK
jgi:hypothetical protein